MEAPSTYFTKRARQERASAIGATSSEARTAHLELAVRLVSVATRPPPLKDFVDDHEREVSRDRADNLRKALHKAFRRQNAADFEQLLARMG